VTRDSRMAERDFNATSNAIDRSDDEPFSGRAGNGSNTRAVVHRHHLKGASFQAGMSALSSVATVLSDRGPTCGSMRRT
jgi:hypothetical protein